MKVFQSKYPLKILSILCAYFLLATVFEFHSRYYPFLRSVIFVGALWVILTLNRKHFYWIILFILIAILFNPLFPIYLYNSIIWIPLYSIIGILFLLVSFTKYTKKKTEKIEVKKRKVYQRDKIY